MFGYIIPAPQELLVREFDDFKACYCGLCHTLGKQYGAAARLVLNYDFVFLAMLLWQGGEAPQFSKKHCLACPYKRKRCVEKTDALENAAGMSVILAWWKLRDSAQDETGIKKLFSKMLCALFKRTYLKAKKEYPDFDGCCSSYLQKLTELEKARCASLDEPADCFAKILMSAAASPDEKTMRIRQEILYHIGRWIYIVDAYDDMEEDQRSGSYNPIFERFGKSSLSQDEIDRLKTTLAHSRNIAGNSLELMDETVFTGILRNIVYYGMPSVLSAVLKKEFRKQKFRH